MSDRLRAPRSPVFMRGLPPVSPGLRIGLLGGSFNPPHAAHRAATLFAMKRLQLDVVWWLVSPGNPLKNNGNLHDLAERAEAAVGSPIIRGSWSAVSKASLVRAILSTPSPICAGDARKLVSSGSWEPTISPSFIAGGVGSRLRVLFPSRPSIAPRKTRRRKDAVLWPHRRRKLWRVFGSNRAIRGHWQSKIHPPGHS